MLRPGQSPRYAGNADRSPPPRYQFLHAIRLSHGTRIRGLLAARLTNTQLLRRPSSTPRTLRTTCAVMIIVLPPNRPSLIYLQGTFQLLRILLNRGGRHHRELSGVLNGMQTRTHPRNGPSNPRILETISSPSPLTMKVESFMKGNRRLPKTARVTLHSGYPPENVTLLPDRRDIRRQLTPSRHSCLLPA